MWSMQNTEGFRQDELDTINAVVERIKAVNLGLEESSINDAITNEYRKGLTEAELFEAVVKRLRLVR